MIVETAFIDIIDGREHEFEVALESAKNVLAQAPGFLTIYVHRGVERPNTYMLALGWEKLEDHTVGFRESELFTEWRALIGPYFANPPQVEHWTLQA